jgi:carbon-monoxide dehydrogenase large subunit
VADRSEAFLSDAHGRDHVSHAEMALDKDGKFLACGAHHANLGAYLSTFASACPPSCTPRCWPASTPRRQIYVRGGRCSPTPRRWTPTAAPAGPRPPTCSSVWWRPPRGNWASTRPRSAGATSSAASRTRRRWACTYDTGDYDATLDQAHRSWPTGRLRGPQGRQREVAKGLLRGIGYSALHRGLRHRAVGNIVGALGARAGLFECGEVRVHPTGSVTVFTGSHSHGQGHETTFAQVVADKLGIPIDDVDIVHGDTGRVPFGMGTYGSRSLARGRLGHREGARQDRSPRARRSPPT